MQIKRKPLIVTATITVATLIALALAFRGDSEISEPIRPKSLSNTDKAISDPAPGDVDSRVSVPANAEPGSDQPSSDSVSDSTSQQSSGVGGEADSKFPTEYKGWTDAQINIERRRVQILFAEERDRIFKELRDARVVFETTLSASGAVPRPPESFEHGMYQTIINPAEVDRQRDEPKAVWFVHASQDSYPDLYELRDRLRWLKQQ